MSVMSRRRLGVLGGSALALCTLLTAAWIHTGPPAAHRERKGRDEEGAGEAREGGPRIAPSDWFVAQRAFPGTEIPHGAYLSALDAARALRTGSGSMTTDWPGSWQAAGPDNIGGRITALAVNPTATSTIYAGAAD